MSARPIVLLHGFLGAPSMWQSVEEHLTSRAITDRLVLPGHGREPWFPLEPSDFSSSVDAIAKTFPFSDPAIIVGYSMGARIALALALRHPEKIAAAVLIGVDAGIEDDAMRTERIRWDDAWADRAAKESVEAFASAWENLPLFESQKNLSSAVRDDLWRQRTSHTSNGISWAMQSLGLGRMPSLWPELALTQVPLTLITGARDHKFTEKSRAIAMRAINARAVVAEDVGHNVALEGPQVVAREIERTLPV